MRVSSAEMMPSVFHYTNQCSEFDVRANFWSVWTRKWHFEDLFRTTVLTFEAIWTDRFTQLGKVPFPTLG